MQSVQTIPQDTTEGANLDIVTAKNTDIVSVEDLIIATKNSFKSVDNKPFTENYPYLTVDNIKRLPYLVRDVIDKLEDIERTCTYEDDYGRNQYYSTDYYTDEMFEKEDIALDKQFLKEYLANHTDKKINVSVLEDTAVNSSKELLDNPEVFKLLSLMTNLKSKEEMLQALDAKQLGNIPMLAGSTSMAIQDNKEFNFYETLLKLECPLYFSKEFETIDYVLPSDRRFRDCCEYGDAYTLFETNIFDIRYFKGNPKTWDEIHIYLTNDSEIMVSNIGKCNYSDDMNVTDIKTGVWHDVLNDFVSKLISFDELIKDFTKRRYDKHMELREHYKNQFETNKLAEIEATFFVDYKSKKAQESNETAEKTQESNETSEKSQQSNETAEKKSVEHISKEVEKALGCFGIQEAELKKLTQKKVTEIYRNLVKINHPDKHNNSVSSAEKTKELNISKDILITYLKERRPKKKLVK